jgi:hypothetical protein
MLATCILCNIQIKHLKHTFETTKTLETYPCNMHMWPLQHRQYEDETLENILLKYLKTLETRCHLRPRHTWWETAVASKQCSGAMEREDGSKQAAGRGEDAAPEQSVWTMLRQLEELGGEW